MARGLRGVKDDLSEIGRHLLDIACFFSPFIATTYADSPPSSPHSPNPNPNPRSPPPIADLSDIGGGFRNGMSRLSSVLRRPGVGKEREPSGRAGGAGLGGVREEVIGFVRDLVKCPGSWVESPIPVDDHFDMSRDQKEHIATVERLAPGLAALRISLCPSFMNEESFWKVYFALLHPKLNKHESEILSTQQIVEEMRMNQKKLQNRVNSESEIQVAESSSLSVTHTEVCEIQEEEEDEVRAPLPNTDPASLQYIDRWFERPVPGETVSSTYIRPQLSSKEESEADDDNIVFLKKYRSTSSFEEASLGNSPFSSYERLQLLEKTFPKDYHDKPLHKHENKETTDEEMSSWHAVEDSSDFEIVDKS